LGRPADAGCYDDIAHDYERGDGSPAGCGDAANAGGPYGHASDGAQAFYLKMLEQTRKLPGDGGVPPPQSTRWALI